MLAVADTDWFMWLPLKPLVYHQAIVL